MALRSSRSTVPCSVRTCSTAAFISSPAVRRSPLPADGVAAFVGLPPLAPEEQGKTRRPASRLKVSSHCRCARPPVDPLITRMLLSVQRNEPSPPVPLPLTTPFFPMAIKRHSSGKRGVISLCAPSILHPTSYNPKFHKVHGERRSRCIIFVASASPTIRFLLRVPGDLPLQPHGDVAQLADVVRAHGFGQSRSRPACAT